MQDLNALDLPALLSHLCPPAQLDRFIAEVLAEDLGGRGDVTTESIIDPARRAMASITARQPGIAGGVAVIDRIIQVAEADLVVRVQRDDGAALEAGQVIAELSGSLRSMLTLERTMLNLIGHLSGVATLTRAYVDAIAGAGAVICDTRKTTPGLRGLEKYAVRCGGGMLHRIGLFDAALYKDNHLAHLSTAELAQTIAAAVDHARAGGELRFVEVEVDSIDQFEALLALPDGTIDIVLLDNMDTNLLHAAVELRQSRQPGLLLEASGGITLESVRCVAETGVDRISIGALTHSAACLDVGLDMP